MSLKLDAIIDSKTLEKSIEKGVQAWNRKRAGSSTLKLKIDEKGFRQPLGRITGDINMFDDALAASNARVIAFGASTAVIGGISKAFRELAKTTVEVQKSFSEINRILDLSTKRFEKFGNQLFDISKKNATSFQDTTKAALEFARQGLQTEETLKRTADALTLVRLTGINADKAVSSLTATVNAFDSAMVTTSTSLNKFVAVETKFAVGAKDLVEAIGRVGSSAKDAKVGFDELNAMVTAVQQSTGRGGAVIGNAMKTIFTRLQRQSTLTALESYNVAVRDIEGNTLPAMRILDNFAQKYKGLADASQGYLREQVAGVFQANILSAVLRDLGKNQSTYGQALKISTGATNEADQATAKLNQSLSALVTQTGIEFKRLQENIGKATFEPIARSIMEPLKSAMEGLNELLDSEGMGSDVANGILKGIKNVIGGPGLIAIGGIILKVFANTVGYMAKALPSLVGMTTETQKRAAFEQFIEAALAKEADLAKAVAAAEGNAALQAQLLLGHAKKTATELDKQETSLQNIVRMMAQTKGGYAATTGAMKGKGAFGRGAGGFIPGMAGEVQDIRRGVGGVSPGSKPVSIPNFAFGGGVRGTMVANSGEYIVPNYSNGGSAIFNPNMVSQYGMPAGAKPIRGAAGYVPNFVDVNKLTLNDFSSMSNKEIKAGGAGMVSRYTGLLSPLLHRKKTSDYFNETPQKQIAKFGARKGAAGDALKNVFTTSNIAMLTPPSGIGAGNFGQSNFGAKNSIIPGMSFGIKYPKYTYNPKRSSKDGTNIEPIEEHIENGIIAATRLFTASINPPAKSLDETQMKAALNTAQGGAGAVAAAAGAAFEVGVSQALGLKAAQPEKGKSLDVPIGTIASRSKLNKLFSTGGTGKMMPTITGADFKISDSVGNSRSMAEKIIAKDSASFNKFAASRKKRGARGYVPNFAALGDAVEREAAAGVPLGRIRVNRSSRLSSPNNPAGLGVTNTRDEPQGLKDVYGAARGYVPNFVDFSKLSATDQFLGGRWSKLLDSEQKKLVTAYQKQIADMKFQDMTEEQLKAAQNQLIVAVKAQLAGKKLTKSAEDRLRKEIMQETAELARSKPGASGGEGAMGGRGMMAGMALSFGAPMLAGGIEQAGGPKEASSALTGVGTGAALGMMIPGPWGIAIGAAAGGLIGFGKEAIKVGKDLATLSQDLEQFEATTKENTTAGQAYIQAQKDILTSTSQSELENAQKRAAKSLEELAGTGLEKKFSEAGDNVESLTGALADFTLAAGAERQGRQAVIAGKQFEFGDTTTRTRLMGDQGGLQEVTETIKFAGQKTEAEFIKVFGELFQGMKDLPVEAIALAAKETDFGFDNKDVARDKIVKLLKGKEGFKGLEADTIESMLTDPVLAVMENFPEIMERIKDETGKEKEARQEQAKKQKELTQTYIDITRIVGETAAEAKAAPLQKFKAAFKKLNSAFVSIGADIMTVTGDVVGASRFRANQGNIARRLGEGQQRGTFGMENASKVLKAFSGTIGNSDSALSALREVTEKLISDPSAGIKALQKEILSAGRFRVVKDSAGKDIVDPKTGLPKSAVTEPAKMIAFELMVKNMQVAFDTQEKNIEAQRIVSQAQNKIELLKAQNAEIQKRIVHDQLMVQKERKHQIAKEEIVVNSRIAALEREGADPRQARGLTFRQELGRTQKLDKARLMEEQKLRNAQMVEENNMVLQKLASDAALIAANYRLVGADEELADAVDNLARIMAAGTFQKEEFLPSPMASKRSKEELAAEKKAYVESKMADWKGGGRFLGEMQYGADFDQAAKEREEGREPKLAEERLYYDARQAQRRKDHIDRMVPKRGGGGTGLNAIQAATTVLGGIPQGQKGESTEQVLKKQLDFIQKAKTATDATGKSLLMENEQYKRIVEAAEKTVKFKKEIVNLENTEQLKNLAKDQQQAADIAKEQTSFKKGLEDGFNVLYKDIDQIYNRLGKDLPTAFRDGMVNAMESALDGADSFSDALRGSAIEFLKIIRRASLESAMNNVTSLFGMGVSKGFRESGPKQRGGIIGAQQGMYISGNRTGDRNPALLEDGEYVLNKKAVKAMGGPAALNNINFGMAPRFQGGGSMFLNESATSDRMSGFFLTSDNPELAEAREEARKKYEERQRKKAEKKAMKKQFLSTLISTGIGMGVSAIGSRMQQRSSMGKLEKMTASAGPEGQLKRTGSFIKGYNLEGSEEALANVSSQKYLTKTQIGDLGLDVKPGANVKMPRAFKQALHGEIDNRLETFWQGAQGFGRKEWKQTYGTQDPTPRGKGPGKISGGYMNRDSIPAFLSGGEYVMNNRAVKKYGLGFMGRLNGGLIPGFQGGGSVGAESPAPLNAQSANNTNNISINISMGGDGSGNKAGTAEGNENANLEGNKDDKTKSKELSERIRSAVVKVIAEEQRVGGSLSSTGKGR